MQKFDVIFKNGEIVTENGKEKADLGIIDGKISAIGILNDEASIIEDASNLIILPGGIDAHVHIDQPSGPDVEMADNFQTATMSAAAGGSTTVLPFAMQEKGQSLRQCVEDYHKKAKDIEQLLNSLSYIKKVEPVETNIIIFYVKDHLNAEDFISKMEEKNILLTPMGDGKIRIVTHLDFSDQMLEKLLYELKRF